MNKPYIIQEIYDLFVEYFGEDKVDLQVHTAHGYLETVSACWAILIHWPEVIVTNEYDKSVVIWHLYGKILLNNDGKLMQVPLFNRSEYNAAQWGSDYFHSHVNSINKQNLSEWKNSCLGSGPINVTIAKLRNSYYSSEHNYVSSDLYTDMDVWRLFIWELDKYVHIESLVGIPYKKIKDIGISNKEDSYTYCFYTNRSNLTRYDLIASFIRHLINQKVLKFNYINGGYSIGMSFTETVLTISNTFIEWYNSNPQMQSLHSTRALYNESIIKEVYIVDDKIVYKDGESNIPLITKVGETMFTFKGKDVKFTINGDNSTSSDTVNILSMDVLGYIIYKILRFINVKYGKSENTISCKARIF